MVSSNKTKPTSITVEDFLGGTSAQRFAEARVLIELMQGVTGEKPVMWGPSIIGFGSYHYKYASGHEGDAPIVGFSPRKANLVVYIVLGFDGMEGLLAALGRYTTGKSCLYLKRLADADPDVLRQMVETSVVRVRARFPVPMTTPKDSSAAAVD